MVDIPLPPPFTSPHSLHLTVNIKWCSTFLQLSLINSTSPAPIFWTPPPPNTNPHPHQSSVRFEWTAYLTGLSTGRYNRRMRWVHSLPSGRKCCLLPGSIPLCYSINHMQKEGKQSQITILVKKKNSMIEMTNQYSSKLFQNEYKRWFFSSVLLSSNSKTF